MTTVTMVLFADRFLKLDVALDLFTEKAFTDGAAQFVEMTLPDGIGVEHVNQLFSLDLKVKIVGRPNVVVFEKETFEVVGETSLDFNSEYGDHYSAMGRDTHGNEVKVRWEIKNEFFESLQDETEACDWDNPVAIN